MSITIIAAIAANNVIGDKGGIPWYLPKDLKRFKRLTMGKVVVMGRKTYESIPPKFRPLKGRTNVVLSRDPMYSQEGCTVCHSVQDVLDRFPTSEHEIMVAGGQGVYEKFLPLADSMELTRLGKEPEGDTFFPAWDEDDWEEVEADESRKVKPTRSNTFGLWSNLEAVPETYVGFFTLRRKRSPLPARASS